MVKCHKGMEIKKKKKDASGLVHLKKNVKS